MSDKPTVTPLFLVLGFAASMGIGALLATLERWQPPELPAGKSYIAAGTMIYMVPADSVAPGTVRILIETPDGKFFSVYFRKDHAPPFIAREPVFLQYHQCGMQGGAVVHCFDFIGSDLQIAVPSGWDIPKPSIDSTN